MNAKHIKLDLLPRIKLGKYENETKEWEVLIGHNFTELSCDPINHFVFNEVLKIFDGLDLLEHYHQENEIHLGSFLQEIVLDYLKVNHLLISDAIFTNNEHTTAISFKLTRNMNENYSVLFNYPK